MFVLAKFKKESLKASTSFMITKKELKEINLLGTKDEKYQRFVVEGKNLSQNLWQKVFNKRPIFYCIGPI